ncbi:NERD domain-containing protein [Rhizobium sp. SG741]|uniref:NERD domain-containing protein n=1 Tax=Rhizobium sp. SG741 TaxID=2587114 RepID=UPI00144640FC|nr:NERD domain-containing protein [Rhizobium sp. SG741]NKJ03109.1 hypothetical protein [Rhizobium sp. SG741]
MPAYRSSAEAEIRQPVVEMLRLMIPGCRIVHEINTCSFGNRIDVLAIGVDRLVAVEIKSAKDKLDRLPDQIKAMRGVTPFVFAALHEKFVVDLRGQAFPPDQARGATVWIYPKAQRSGHIHCGERWHNQARYRKPTFCLPPEAIRMLWRDELHAILRRIGIKSISKLDMDESIDRIRWNLTGEQITHAICTALRTRICVEADPPIPANDNNPMRLSA